MISQNSLDRSYLDEPDGESTVFFQNGKIAERYTKENGHLHGYIVRYYESGQTQSICKLDHGRFMDTSILYTEKGQIRALDIFRNDTLLYCEYNYFWPNGTRRISEKYFLTGLNIDISELASSNRVKGDLIYVDLRKVQGCIYKEIMFDNNDRAFQQITKISNQISEKLQWDKKGKVTKKCYVAGKRSTCP